MSARGFLLAGIVLAASCERAPDAAPFRFRHAALLKPRSEPAPSIDPYLAPLIYEELLDQPASDGSGPAQREVLCSSLGNSGVDLPTVYTGEGLLQRAGGPRRQLSFGWFVTLAEGAAALPQGLRITLDADGYPALLEVLAGAGETRATYVTESLEQAAFQAFGGPLAGRRFSIEGEHAAVVDVIGTGSMPMGPFVYQPAASAGLAHLHCRCSPSRVDELGETREYALEPRASLAPELAAQLDFGPPESAGAGLRLPPSF